MDAPPVDPELLAFATEIVRRAGEFTLTHFRSAELHIERKDDGSPVTVADQGAERLLRADIAARFPDDAILGEEHGEDGGTSGRRWVIDPIDGTEAFTHGVGLYSNLLYLEDEHGPAVGVINVPALGEIVYAGRGLGCFLNGLACSVSDTPAMRGSLLTTSSFEHWDPAMLGRLHGSGMRMKTWGDGFGYMLVASGRAEAMVDPAVKEWDIAPCRVIIPEAGGRFTALDGTEDLSRGDAIATNGRLHDEITALLGA